MCFFLIPEPPRLMRKSRFMIYCLPSERELVERVSLEMSSAGEKVDSFHIRSTWDLVQEKERQWDIYGI